jgi:hypothetical protein
MGGKSLNPGYSCHLTAAATSVAISRLDHAQVSRPTLLLRLSADKTGILAAIAVTASS